MQHAPAPHAAPAPVPAPALDISGLSFSRDGETVLQDVSLRVDQGGFLAVLGPNGGGKTTLLRIVLGLLRPDVGTLAVFGRAPEEVRTQLGYVPQYSTMRPDFPATVLQLTLMGASGKGWGGTLWPEDKAARVKALELLSVLGIADEAKRPISALSGGQRQRLLVARALMGRPANAPFLLLLDEPTASIDPQGKFCFYEFLHKLRGEITIIVVSHDLSMASPFFSHVALVNRTLTLAPGGKPSFELLQSMLGAHSPECPMGNLMQGGQSKPPSATIL